MQMTTNVSDHPYMTLGSKVKVKYTKICIISRNMNTPFIFAECGLLFVQYLTVVCR